MAESLALIGVALAAVSTGVGVYSAVESGNAAKEAGKNQQRAANASAQAAAQAGALEAGQIRRRNIIRLGAYRAAAGSSGTDIGDSGDLFYDTAIQGELEALSATYSGNSSAVSLVSRGNVAAAEGSRAAGASYLRGAGSLIGGLSKTGDAYSDYRAKKQPTLGGV